MAKKRLYLLPVEPKSIWGFKGKTFLDVAQVLGFPFAALIMTLFLAYYDAGKENIRLKASNDRNEMQLNAAVVRENNRINSQRDIADRVEQYRILLDYVSVITQLRLEGLGTEKTTCIVGPLCPSGLKRNIAETRTSLAVSGLDGDALNSLLLFLSDTELLNSIIKVRLDNKNIKGGNLVKINLEGIQMSGISLVGAYMTGANLSNAYMKGADLTGTDLSNSNLFNAHLREADLIGTNLTMANLEKANLYGANLKNANLTLANLAYAGLANTKGLTCEQLKRGKNWQKAIVDITCKPDTKTTE